MRAVYELLFNSESRVWDAGRLYFIEYARQAVGVIDRALGLPGTT